MPYDPSHHHRRSIRLPTYNYTRPGAYFVTICAWSRGDHFGVVDAGELRHNAAGQMVAERWEAIGRKFPLAALDVFVVMPDHLHGIIILGQMSVQSEDGSAALGRMVGWFKTMATNAYIRGVSEQGWPAFAGKLWQRNYYEHIIRDEADLVRVRDYITSNPARWHLRHAR